MSNSTLGLTEPLRSYLLQHSRPESASAADARAQTATRADARMQISPEQGALMSLLVRLMRPRHYVEIGTFTGYSALIVAEAMDDGGRITTCDIDPGTTELAWALWARAGVADRVHAVVRPALETLREIPDGTVDMVFVDADKESYVAYVNEAARLLRVGGLLMVDNVLWSGSVIDPNDDRETTRCIRETNAHLAADPRFFVSMLPVGDGLTLALRQG